MTHFDFSSYHRPPPGLKLLRADSELWLWREADRRYYRVWCPEPGWFVLMYSGTVQERGRDKSNEKWEFILRTKQLLKVLKAIGALRSIQPKKTQLQIPGTNLGVHYKR